ncbi:MAG: tetratricopeptide repeat protein [Planctomycetota bacterium]
MIFKNQLTLALLALFMGLPPLLQADSGEENARFCEGLLKNGKIAEARDGLSKALETHPRSLAVRLAWASLMEQVGDVPAAIEAYQGILDQIREEGAEGEQNYSALQTAKKRLSSLLDESPKLLALNGKYVEENLTLGQKVLGEGKSQSARHAFDEVLRSDGGHAEALKGLGQARLQLPEPGKALATADSNMIGVVLGEVRRHLRENHPKDAILALEPFMGLRDIRQQDLHYEMAQAQRMAGDVEKALYYYDVYLYLTAGSKDSEVQTRRQAVEQILPKLTDTLKEMTRRRGLYISNLLSFATSVYQSKPAQAQRAIDEILKFDPSNARAERLQNRIIELGSTPLFGKDLLKNWTLLRGSPPKPLVSHLSDTRFEKGLLTLPKRGEPVIVAGPATFPGYGLVKASFRFKATLPGEVPERNFGFGFAIHNTDDDTVLLMLLTLEPNTGQIAARAVEQSPRSVYTGLGAMYTTLKRFDEFVTLEAFRQGNEMWFYVNGEKALEVRYAKGGPMGRVGLFSAGNAVEVKDLIYSSGLQRINRGESWPKPLFNHGNLAGWWVFNEQRQAFALQPSETVVADNTQLRFTATPGSPFIVYHQERYSREFTCTLRFTSQPFTEDAVTEWIFGKTDHEEKLYLLRLSSRGGDGWLELLDSQGDGTRKVLAEGPIQKAPSDTSVQELKMATSGKDLLVFHNGVPLLKAELPRPVEGYSGLRIERQVFVLLDMILDNTGALPSK